MSIKNQYSSGIVCMYILYFNCKYIDTFICGFLGYDLFLSDHQLLMWEGVRGDSLDGVFLFQPTILKEELVKRFGEQFHQLLQMVSKNPMIPLKTLVSAITPPFCHASGRRRKL